MKNVNYEISEDDYKKALEKGARSLVSESVIMGYGCYCARVYEQDGKYYLSYDMGDSCD